LTLFPREAPSQQLVQQPVNGKPISFQRENVLFLLRPVRIVLARRSATSSRVGFYRFYLLGIITFVGTYRLTIPTGPRDVVIHPPV